MEVPYPLRPNDRRFSLRFPTGDAEVFPFFSCGEARQEPAESKRPDASLGSQDRVPAHGAERGGGSVGGSAENGASRLLFGRGRCWRKPAAKAFAFLPNIN